MRGIRNRGSDMGQRGAKAQARRYLTGNMAKPMIRGITDEQRARAYLGVANELYEQGEIDEEIRDMCVAAVADCSE